MTVDLRNSPNIRVINGNNAGRDYADDGVDSDDFISVQAISPSGGARYTWLGDADPETGTPDVARANFTDNTALSLGLRIGYDF